MGEPPPSGQPGDGPERYQWEQEAQDEYEHALEILIFANGGRGPAGPPDGRVPVWLHEVPGGVAGRRTMADEILVLDQDRYVGESTRLEIEFAEAHGKRVRYLSDETATVARER
jgi:hypothetical protein